MTPRELAARLEYSLLRADGTRADVERVCREAKQWKVYAVCVSPCRVPLAVHLLEDSSVKVATVAGYPLGSAESDVKRFETEAAMDAGAQEIDVVLNLGWLKEGQDRHVLRELRDVVEAADGRPVRAVLEAGWLTREEILRGGRLAVEAEMHAVKTCTDWGPRGTQAVDLQLLRESLGAEFPIIAAGAVRDVDTARALLDAGALRVDTSSAGTILDAAGRPPVL